MQVRFLPPAHTLKLKAMENYHNTVPETGEKLQEYQRKAVTQQEEIMFIFKFELEKASPKQIYYHCLAYGHNWPITSIRRAISNLEASGFLEKTGERVPGIYDRDENVWRVRS